MSVHDGVSSAGNNNFNLIRIGLSLSVVFYHIYELSGKQELAFLLRFFNGDTAVNAFFIISGFLITESCRRSHSTKEFFIKRVRRIYPAYLAVVLLCAAGGWVISSYSVGSYLTSPHLYKYILANIGFLNFIEPTLPGVFTGNIFEAVNGSLWTLKVEVAFYLLVPLIAWMRSKMNVHWLYALLFVSSVAYYIITRRLYFTYHYDILLFLSRQIPGQLFYFILGAWAAEIKNYKWFRPMLKWIGIPALIILWFPMTRILQSVLLAIAVFWGAYTVPVIKYTYKREDISYGIYIYHFPVIQVLVSGGFFRSPFYGLVLTLVFTFILSVLSWIYIEKPFIAGRVNRKMVLG